MEDLEKTKQVATSKKTLGQQYSLEKERIKHEVGDLEQIRMLLGYSQRRMCQLLLVDPSAWTRWTKSLRGAPPHIYRALHWLIQLTKINPEAAAPTNLSKRIDFVQSKISSLEQSMMFSPPQHSSSQIDFEAALRHQESRWALAIANLEKKLKLALKNKGKKKKAKPKKKAKKNARKKSNSNKSSKQKNAKRKIKKKTKARKRRRR